MAVELIPGTALPVYAPGAAEQPEGRGGIQLRPERQPPSLLERIDDPEGLTPAERMVVAAALRAFENKPKRVKHIDATVGGQTDATTGNLVIPLYQCPAGCELHITNVTVDPSGSATITPSAPYSNAASYMFLSISGSSTGTGSATATVNALRNGLAAFAPTSAAGPIIPGQWTFNDSNARIAFGGETVYFVFVGGSIAAVLNLALRVSFRFNLLSDD